MKRISLIICLIVLSCSNENNFDGYWMNESISSFYKIEDTIAIRYFYNRKQYQNYYVLKDTFYLDQEQNTFKTKTGASWGTLVDLKRIHEDTLVYNFNEKPSLWQDGTEIPNDRGYYFRTDEKTLLKSLSERFNNGFD
ncbi:hypothetical protein [Pontimicrobium sp. IMCC45349]|uniref:hypothetical protein n=1 Tax=Pontimicrobium sp. IMCC45349 TaxID=3391574 RepID=UPI0039A20C09